MVSAEKESEKAEEAASVKKDGKIRSVSVLTEAAGIPRFACFVGGSGAFQGQPLGRVGRNLNEKHASDVMAGIGRTCQGCLGDSACLYMGRLRCAGKIRQVCFNGLKVCRR